MFFINLEIMMIMKKIHMTKLLISAWMLMLGFAVQAQVYTEYSMKGKNPVGVKHTQSSMDLSKRDKCLYKYTSFDSFTPKRESELKVNYKAEPGEVTLTFNLVYDPEVFMPPYDGVKIINENYNNAARWRGEDVVTATVPAGTYDFIFHVQSMSIGWNQYYVIHEQVEVKGDTTIIMDANEATNHISFINYDENGNVLELGLGHIDQNTGEWIDDEEGNVHVLQIDNQIYLKGMGSVSIESGRFVGTWPEEMRAAPFFEYFINDVSDRYVFTQNRIYNNGPEIWYLNYFSTDNAKAGILENEPIKYNLYNNNYQFSPYGQEQIGFGVETTVRWIENGITVYTSLLDEGLIETKSTNIYPIQVYTNIPYEDPHYNGLNLLVNHTFQDHYATEVDEWSGMEFTYCTGRTYDATYSIDQGKLIYMITHLENEISNVVEDNHVKSKLLPTPTAFTYPFEERMGVIGNNCPINAGYVKCYYNDYLGDAVELYSYYVGRYGELRNCDAESTTLALKFNGEYIEDLDNWSHAAKGIWEFTISNTNIEVDGIRGENKTVVHFDENLEDNMPPSIQMLHFRNEEGVTDRFVTSAEGTMEFMGGDINYQYIPEIWNGVFDECHPMDVTVEYSPYGEENWQELVVEEVPELFQMPGWGYFYRASLADVTGKATQGWFDLRFLLQDEAGNWQEQVVSPAFRIDDLISTAVEEVNAAADVREVARYSVDGRQLSAPQPGLNIIRMSNGTSRKVWVK